MTGRKTDVSFRYIKGKPPRSKLLDDLKKEKAKPFADLKKFMEEEGAFKIRDSETWTEWVESLSREELMMVYLELKFCSSFISE